MTWKITLCNLDQEQLSAILGFIAANNMKAILAPTNEGYTEISKSIHTTNKAKKAIKRSEPQSKGIGRRVLMYFQTMQEGNSDPVYYAAHSKALQEEATLWGYNIRSMSPALSALQNAGFLKYTMRQGPSGRAVRYYTLSEKGKSYVWK